MSVNMRRRNGDKISRPVCGVAKCLEALSLNDRTDTKMADVRYDIDFRTEGIIPLDLPVGDDSEALAVMWERPNLLFQNSSRMDDFTGDESETDDEVAALIKDFNKRKRKGGRVNGEYIYYDESLSCVRNIHCSSISLTEYGEPPDHEDFGRRKIMRPLLTPEERAMLGIPPLVPRSTSVPPVPVSTASTSSPTAETQPPRGLTFQGLVLGLEKIGFRPLPPRKK